jgi:hypothetical protein
MMFARPGRIEAIKQIKEHDKRLKSMTAPSGPPESRQLSDRPAVPSKNNNRLPPISGSFHRLKQNYLLKQLILIVCASLLGFLPVCNAQLKKNYPVDSNFIAADSRNAIEARLKSTDKAILTSIMHTLIPAGIGTIILVGSNPSIFGDEDIWMVSGLFISYGALIGPSAGNFYARDAVRGAAGIIMRTGSGFLLSTPNSQTRVIGYAIFFGSAIYNFATCGQSVKKYNERHFRSMNLSLNPKIDIPGNNFGIKLKIQFN